MQTFQVPEDSSHYRKLAFSPDGRYLAVDTNTLTILDTTGGPAQTISQLGIFRYSLAFVQNGAAIACTPFGGELRILDLATNVARTHKPAKRYPLGVAADPQADEFYVSVSNFTGKSDLRVYGVADLQERAVFGTTEYAVSRLALSANGHCLAGPMGRRLLVWHVGQDRLPQGFSTVVQTKVEPSSFALSADGTLLAAGVSTTLRIWKTENGEEVARSGKHKRSVTAVACNPTKPIIATGDNAGNVFLWDHTARVITRLDWGLGHTYGLTFAPDGLRCAAVGSNGKVVVWDVDL